MYQTSIYLDKNQTETKDLRSKCTVPATQMLSTFVQNFRIPGTFLVEIWMAANNFKLRISSEKGSSD